MKSENDRKRRAQLRAREERKLRDQAWRMGISPTLLRAAMTNELKSLRKTG